MGDQVLLDTRNLNLKGNKKLKARYVGPFVVTKLVGPVACKLDLGHRLRGAHNVFHVSLLKPYLVGGDGVAPPEPIEVDGNQEYEVERVLAHRDRRGRQREYLVRWVGHDSLEDMWLPESELANARAVLQQYQRTHPPR